MNLRLMSRAWALYELQMSAKFVLLALADYADDDGQCSPTLEMIAAKTRLDFETVWRAVRELEAQGHIHIDRSGERWHYTVKL